ncbi:MAG: 1-acyl-sn-glycerol-3-phosphate acyltransferase [Proteobacteria bacterium]|nr:1-acyl-sn-glycerol-3-phosphate acyltransferase [Pseudomonadota bacterium]
MGRAGRATAGPVVERRRDFFAWRFLGTAASFTLFGLVGIVLGVVVFPLGRLVPLARRRRAAIGRAVVSACFRGFIGFMRRTGVLSYEFRGAERLGQPGQLILANHPSLIDVVFLIGFARRPGCVVKSALWSNPFTGGVVTAAGYVPNAPTDRMIEGAAEALREGQALIMFPEGTRTTPGEPFRFHRGAAAVAIRAARSLTPVYITVTPTTLTKDAPWYRIPWRRPHFALEVGADIDLGPFAAAGPPPIAARALNEHLVRHFGERLGRPGAVEAA